MTFKILKIKFQDFSIAETKNEEFTSSFSLLRLPCGRGCQVSTSKTVFLRKIKLSQCLSTFLSFRNTNLAKKLWCHTQVQKTIMWKKYCYFDNFLKIFKDLAAQPKKIKDTCMLQNTRWETFHQADIINIFKYNRSLAYKFKCKSDKNWMIKLTYVFLRSYQIRTSKCSNWS